MTTSASLVAQLISVIVGVAIFVVFIHMVGNPHVVETGIGVVLAIAGGFFAYSLISHRVTRV